MNPLDPLIVAAPLLATGNSDGNSTMLLLLLAGPAAGVLTYLGIYRYYRNTDKRHHFETETRVRSTDLRVIDNRVSTIRRTQKATTDGRNDANHLQRVHRIDLGDQPGDPRWVQRQELKRAQSEQSAPASSDQPNPPGNVT